MQIYNNKIRGQASLPDSELPESLEDESLQQEGEKSVEGFFGFDSEIPSPPLTPFDALVSGMPGTRAENLQGFNIPKVPSFDEVVMSDPQLKLKIKKTILPLYDKAINYFEKRIVDLKQVLKQTGIPAKERIALQDLLETFNQAKAEALIQKGVAEKAYADLVNIGRQEFIYRTDLNGDRVIGYDLDDEKTLYVAQLPDGKEVIVNKNREPVFDPVFDDSYTPALAEQENLKLIDRANRNDPNIVHPEESPMNVDEVLQIRNYRHEGWDSPLGAQIHIVPPEGMWVRADEKGDPKIIKGKIGEERKLVPKKFELIEREDGKQMIGQKPPSPEERGKWVFVRINDLKISTHKLDGTAPNANGIERSLDGGNVHFEFKGNVGNQEGILISRIAVQGYKTEAITPVRSDNAGWVMASSVGVAISSGKTVDGKYTDHSSRIRHLNVDAAGLITTSKILPTKEEMVRYGIEDKFDAEGNFIGADGADGAVVNDQDDIDRGNKAANYTLKEGWLATTKGANGSVEKDIWTRFGGDEISTRQIFLSENTKYNEFRTGLISIDIAGNIRGTQQSDFIVTGLRQTEEIEKFLPIGTEEEVPSHHPTYATVVDGYSGGRDILISNGGDLYARDMTYVKRNSDRVNDQIYISTKDGRVKNQAIYIDIGDAQPAEVFIDNKQDPNLDKSEDDISYREGTPDDWYQGPANSIFKFSQKQNDASDNIVEGVAEGVADAFTTTQRDLKDFIDQNPMALAKGFDPKSGFQIPEWIDKEDKNEGGFFEEFAVFNQEQDDSWQSWMNELSKE